MTKKPALGRGLSALIPSARPAGTEGRPGASVQMVDIDHLEANRQQPRRRFDDEGIDELAKSINETGILQPILVTRDGERFRIVAGDSWLAGLVSLRAGERPAVILDGDLALSPWVTPERLRRESRGPA